MSKVPVITIETINGSVDINASDFNPEIHKLFLGKSDNVLPPLTPEQSAELEKVETVEVPEAFTVGKNGKRGAASKFIVLDSSGNPFTDIEYDTKEAAEHEIKILKGEVVE